ncbi:MAG: patatin-like phospholipase family protein [Gemmatimonadaceae bacterium]
MTVCRSVLIALVAVYGASATSLHAQAPGSTPDTVFRNVTVSVSGGISLGSWQGGATWATISLLRKYEAERHTRDARPQEDTIQPYRLAATSGASAGNINALLAAIAWCTDTATAVLRPDQSTFWHVWTNIGFEELTKPSNERRGQGILSRAAFTQVWATALSAVDQYNARSGNESPSCDLPIGLTTTRLRPVQERVGQTGIFVDVQRSVGIFRLSKGLGKDNLRFIEPTKAQVEEPSLGRAIMVRPDLIEPGHVATSDTTIRRKVSYEALLNLVLASSSFPVAFGPVRLEAYTRDCLDAQFHCKPDYSYYADGGVFDNQAIGAALALERASNPGSTASQRNRDARLLLPLLAVCRDTSVSTALQKRMNALAAELDTSAVSVRRSRGDTAGARTLSDSLTKSRNSRPQWLKSLPRAVRTEQISSLCAALEAVERDSVPSSPPRRVEALFLDDAVLRGPMERRRVRSAEDDGPPTSPIRAAGSLLFNAAGPARQYELAVLSRSLRKDGDTSLTSTSRALPLGADGFAHFGAFFARAFRYHDFYVGVYDGMRHAVETFGCRNTGVDLPECIEKEMRRMLEPGGLNLGCDARIMIATLRQIEIQDSPKAGWVKALPSPCTDTLAVGGDAGPKGLLRDRGRVLSALALAADEAANSKLDAPGTCVRRSLIDGPFCDANLAVLFDLWKVRLKTIGIAAPTNCHATSLETRFDSALAVLNDHDAIDTTRGPDSIQCELLADPNTTYHSSIAKLLVQLQLMESGGTGSLADVASYFERAQNVAFDPRRRVGNPVVPDPQWWGGAARVVSWLPYSADRVWNRDVTLGWLPLAKGWSASRLKSTAKIEAAFDFRIPTNSGATLDWNNAFPGLGISLSPPWKMLNSVHLHGLRNLSGRTNSVKLTTVWLADIIRVGYRWDRNERAQWFAGVGDVTALSAGLVKLVFFR